MNSESFTQCFLHHWSFFVHFILVSVVLSTTNESYAVFSLTSSPFFSFNLFFILLIVCLAFSVPSLDNLWIYQRFYLLSSRSVRLKCFIFIFFFQLFAYSNRFMCWRAHIFVHFFVVVEKLILCFCWNVCIIFHFYSICVEYPVSSVQLNEFMVTYDD